MPNLRFSAQDTAAVLDYLDEASSALPALTRAGVDKALAAYETSRAQLAADDLRGTRAGAAPLAAAAARVAELEAALRNR